MSRTGRFFALASALDRAITKSATREEALIVARRRARRLSSIPSAVASAAATDTTPQTPPVRRQSRADAGGLYHLTLEARAEVGAEGRAA